ncbi:MAG: hypothetical protein KW804_03110, partial [Candidatus Doudnabacteria bacterium]|nr:hypothetical protein [Candidatus Doudnabacteria bacterium]
MKVCEVGKDHAVARHTLTILRDAETTSPDIYRLNTRRLSLILAGIVSAYLPTRRKRIKTPLEPFDGAELSRQIILVPVLRAGLGMLDAFLEIIPNAIICHVGTERQEEPPFQNIPYYNRLPEKIDDEMIVIVLENMVATGKSVGGVAELA